MEGRGQRELGEQGVLGEQGGLGEQGELASPYTPLQERGTAGAGAAHHFLHQPIESVD